MTTAETNLPGRKPCIDALRFPLAVLVVLIHSYNSQWQAVCGGVAPVPILFLTRVLPSFAVPLFFALSGYLFFLGTAHFDPAAYLCKLRRRSLSLLLPYLTWNALACGLYALRDAAAGRPVEYALSPALLWGCKPLGAASESWLGLPLSATTAPVLEQLWFVRDLMVCVLLSPIFYAVLRRGRVFGLLLFAAVFYGQLWPNFGGMSFTGPWFFALGAWFSLSGRSPLSATRRLLAPSLALLPPCWLALTLFPDGGGWLRSLCGAVCVLAAMTASIHAAALPSWERRHSCRRRKGGWQACRRSPDRHRPGNFLPASSFFLYAAHTIVLLPLTAILAPRAAQCNPAGQTFLLLLNAAAAIGVCLAAFYVLRRWLPRLSLPLTGIRPRPQEKTETT